MCLEVYTYAQRFYNLSRLHLVSFSHGLRLVLSRVLLLHCVGLLAVGGVGLACFGIHLISL